MTRYSLLALLAFLSVALAACGGDGEEAGQPTTAAQGTPMSTPIISDSQFEFPDKGYSVRFPEGWTPVANFLPGPDFSIDAFFAPEEVNGLQPNIAVNCERLPEGMKLDEYFDAKVDVVKQVIRVEPEVGSREVGGEDAKFYRFARQDTDPPIEKTEVFLVTEKCGWDIALTAPYDNPASYEKLFEEFLDSFRLLP
jgi:hypothetical protein